MSVSIPSQHWFFRYKLYHLPFWLLYHFAWWTLFTGDALTAADNIFSIYGIKYVTYVLLQAAGVYFNLYVLLPRLLEPGKYFAYLLAAIATVLVTAGLIPAGYYLSALLSEQTFTELYPDAPQTYFELFKFNALASTLASTTLALSIKLAKGWLQAQNRQRELERENLATELKFLRSQLHPHFLFNTINSIFVLIHKNPDMAAASLAKFSHLLRYQLYECNDAFIPLDREIAYLNAFIELEELRQDVSQELEVKLSPVSAGNVTIAPFLLLPFVENAFKHAGPAPNGRSLIRVELSWVQGYLHLDVTNTKRDTAPIGSDLTAGGIGLRNARRRLDLLYPGQYTLQIEEDDTEYRVQLRLQLTTTTSAPDLPQRQLAAPLSA